MKLIAIFTAVIAVQTDEKCPEANRNVCVLLFQSGSFVLTYTTFRLSHEYTIFFEIYTHSGTSSRWRENLHHYIEEMEDLTRRKPGYKATMNTYAPCRPIMENLQCVRKVL